MRKRVQLLRPRTFSFVAVVCSDACVCSYVEMVFHCDDAESETNSIGEELRFRRTIKSSGACAYKLNGATVSLERYNEQLRELNLNVDVRIAAPNYLCQCLSSIQLVYPLFRPKTC